MRRQIRVGSTRPMPPRSPCSLRRQAGAASEARQWVWFVQVFNGGWVCSQALRQERRYVLQRVALKSSVRASGVCVWCVPVTCYLYG